MTNKNRQNSCDAHTISVALTGGSGFLGTAILQQLLEAGIHVKALQHYTKLPEHKNLTIITGNLSNLGALKQLVKDTQCVIHCGGAVSAKNVKDFFKINTEGTANLVRVSEEENITRFLYISSMAAREPKISPYAESKRAGEEVIQSSSLQGWDIIRPPAIYGPGDKQVLPLLSLLQYRIGVLPGGRQAKFSTIYVRDLANAICCWLYSRQTKGKLYEIDDGSKNGYTWQNLLDNAAETMNIKPYYIVPPLFLMKAAGYTLKIVSAITGKTLFLTLEKLRELSHPDWVRCDKGLIEEDINWVARTDFKTGIKKTIDWYQKKGLLRNSKLEKHNDTKISNK